MKAESRKQMNWKHKNKVRNEAFLTIFNSDLKVYCNQYYYY